MAYRNLFPEIYTPADTLHLLGGCTGQALGSTLRVLVWNMYKARNTGWSEDFQTLIQGKELVLLQESILNTNHDMIFQTPERFEWVMARSHKDRATQATTGVKTGATVKSTAQSFFISPDVEPFLRTPKMLLATTYPIKGCDCSLLVVNIHAINFVSFHKFSRQMKQVMEAIEQHKGPVILAGDFNTWSAMRFKSLIDITTEMDLEEVKLTRKGRLFHLNKNLDHVFCRGLKVVKTEVMMNVRSSDHYPITVEFSIPDAKED